MPVTEASAPSPPSVHLRALVTWCVIFPEVALVNVLLSPSANLLETVGRSALVTVIVVPPAVYVFVPLLLAGATRLAARHFRGRRIPRR